MPNVMRSHQITASPATCCIVALILAVTGLTAQAGPPPVLQADKLILSGKYEQAIKILAAEAEEAADAEVQVTMARALSRVGRYAEAVEWAAKASSAAPSSAPEALIYGRLLETVGRSDEALEVYEAVAAALTAEAIDDAPQLVATGQVLDRYAVLKGLQASTQANNIYNNYFQRAYQDLDDTYWPAHLAAGLFALGKHRLKTARRELEAALSINPSSVDSLVGLAELALRDWGFERCLKLCDRALKINPNHTGARATKARCLLQWRRPQKAFAECFAALAVNPNDQQALALAAAACIRLGRDADAESYAARAREVNPDGWLVPATIAEWLSAVRQFDRAEVYYQRAIELAPNMAEPLAGLGLLHMQQGREDQAREVLRRAHAIDDFRADVVNYLDLLDKMRSFTVVETAHFEIAVDGEHDAAMLDYVAEEAERIFTEVCGDFGHMPTDKTKIQIFPTHAQFSVRITGRGWIGTVGACTGPVIALAAPSDERSQFGAYNWAAVLRHELTHTVTLSATENRIPHWFTEACAVWQQPDRRNYDSVQALLRAVREDRLLPVRELDWGFMRPKRRGDRSLAYAQSELMMEYIIETKGFETILAMLGDFRDGKSQADVFKDRLGFNEKALDKKFNQWATKAIAGWGFDISPRPTFQAAQAAAKKRPDDAKAQAVYARALLSRGETDAAKIAAESALAIDPNEPIALEVAARAAMLDGDFLYAQLYIERLLETAGDSAALARLEAEACLMGRQYDKAIEVLERLKQRQPLDPYSYTMLASLYAQLGRPDDALPNLIELHRRSMSEPAFARQIADVYRARGEDELALEHYRQVIHIDPYDASTHEAIAAIHRNAKRYDQAVKAVRCLTLLSPESAEAWAKLAMVRFVAARADEDIDAMRQAQTEAAKSVELDADGPGKAVLRRIEGAINDMEERMPESP